MNLSPLNLTGSLTGIVVKLVRDGRSGGTDRYPRHYSGPHYLAPLGANRFAGMELKDSTPAMPTMSRRTKAILRQDPAVPADRCSHVVEASSASFGRVRSVAKCPHGDIWPRDAIMAARQPAIPDSAIRSGDSGGHAGPPKRTGKAGLIAV